ncbi:MAG TPA: hypothetical protein DEO84_08925 [candidate division Zixibacteria bacterium]|nr:hypothetical protein [candidate division Zixibacteria bacterium]HBZ01425.1 hypothetical protein [candidate division Zixibacteria bacterium]
MYDVVAVDETLKFPNYKNHNYWQGFSFVVESCLSNNGKDDLAMTLLIFSNRGRPEKESNGGR